MSDVKLLLLSFWQTLKAIGREIRAMPAHYWVAMNVVVAIWVLAVLVVQ